MTTETKHMPSEQETEAAAEAMARVPLTIKGKRECVWPDDWSRDERQMYRNQATAALTAASQVRAPDQSERVRELEAALAEARKVMADIDRADCESLGLQDCIDNSGRRYCSQFLADALGALRDWLTRNSESPNAK